jgi:NTP pyrophosphatase (non-canonical NTP hydrolase)
MNSRYGKSNSGFCAGHEPTILNQQFLSELQKARAKFPARPVSDNEDLLAVLAALNEEVGELNAAIIQWLYEPEKNVSYDDIRKEAAQVGCMVLRVMLDTKLGDASPYGGGVYL